MTRNWKVICIAQQVLMVPIIYILIVKPEKLHMVYHKKSVQNTSNTKKNDSLETTKEGENLHSDSVPCLETRDMCLGLIQSTTGSEPRLLSGHVTQSANHKQHPITGQDMLVPNIVHVVRFGQNYSFTFQHYVTCKSIDKYIKPLLLLIWGDFLPPQSKW